MVLLLGRRAVAKADIGVKVVIIISFVIQMKHILHVRRIAEGQLIHRIRHLLLAVVRQGITIMAIRAGIV